MAPYEHIKRSPDDATGGIPLNVVPEDAQSAIFLEPNYSLTDGIEEISPEQQIIADAQAIYSDYHDRPFNSKTRRELLPNAQSLIQKPQLWETALTYWQQNNPQFAINFSQLMLKSMETVAERLQPAQLADIIRLYTHSPELHPLAARAMQEYFKAGKTKQSRVQSIYTFAQAAVSLSEDTEALRAAGQIGTYSTPVVERESPFYRDVASVFRLGAFDYDPQKKHLTNIEQTLAQTDELVRMAYAADHVLFNIMESTSSQDEYDQTYQAFGRYFDTNEAWHEKVVRELRTMHLALGKQQGDRRYYAFDELRQSQVKDISEVSPGQLEYWMKTYPFSVVYAQSDPLREEFMVRIGVKKVISESNRRESTRLHQLHPNSEPANVSLKLPGTSIKAEITVGDNSLFTDPQKRNLLMQALFKQTKTLETNLNTSRVIGSGSTIPMVRQDGIFEGVNYVVYFRKAEDDTYHEIENLSFFGFPEPIVKPNETVAEALIALKKQVKHDQIRYLNLAGVKVPFTSGAMHKLAYEHVLLKKSAQNLRNIEAVFAIAGQEYTIILDKEFDLDLGGKIIEDAGLRDNMHLSLLRLLYPLLCDESTTSDSKDPRTQVRQIVSRCGHKRRLDHDRYPSEYAIANYWREENQDLVRTYLDSIDEKGYGVTYVQPIQSGTEPRVLKDLHRVLEFA